MVRNFTEEYRQKLIEMIRQNEQEKWCDFTDWVGDRLLDFGDLIGTLDLYKYIGGVDAYTKAILDKNNTTVDMINRIFRNVHDADNEYSKRIRGEMTSAVQDYRRLLLSMADTVSVAGFNSVQIQLLITAFKSLQEKMKEIEYNTEFDKRVYHIVYDKDGRKKNVKEISDADKDKVIEAYENLHPEWKNELDKLLKSGDPNTLSEEEIRDIKYIAYTADEPYRTIYLENIKKYKIGAIGDPDNKGAFYRPSTNKIYFEDDDSGFEDDPRGGYTTFFHESGHAMDNNIGDPFTEEFKFYSEEMGREVTLLEAIEYDVYNNIEEKIREKTKDDASVERILNAFRYGNDTSNLSPKEREVYDWVVSQYNRELAGERNEAACDVYGGMTNLKIDSKGGYGHRPDKGVSVDDYHYWYDDSGNPTGLQSKELWAEYFSYCMTGDEEALESLRKHFPEASKILDEMAKAMAKK